MHLFNKHKLLDAENSLMVARGKGGRGVVRGKGGQTLASINKLYF